MQTTRSVQVNNVSDLATEREIHEFFSFSGDIEHIEIQKEFGQSRIAFVTFTDPKALEIALLLSGATIVDQIVTITRAENYVQRRETQEVRMLDNAMPLGLQESTTQTKTNMDGNSRAYVSKAQDVVATVLAKGSALGQDAVNKAKAFDEKHQLRANASAKVSSFDKRVGLTEKLSVGISAVNEKVKSVDQKLQVSDKTMAAIFAAERKLNDTGSAVKSSRYVTAGAAWFSGAFSKVARVGQVAGSKTKEKFNATIHFSKISEFYNCVINQSSPISSFSIKRIIMGGGRAMATAAKVAGIGVGKGGFKGFGFPPATEQFRVKTAAAAASSKPVSASITSAVHPSVEEDGMIMQRPVWDDWEFAEEEPIPRVVFSKPPSLEEAKEATEDLKEAINLVYMSSPKSSAAMEGSNDGGSVSKMLSGFQSSENRAVESAVPQVALQAFAFLSENTAAQTVVASIASDPKVWDAVMENKDLMKFLQTNKTAVSSQVESDNDDQSERSSTTECEVVETKPMELLEILQDMKLKAVRLMENVSSYFGDLFGLGSVTEDGKDKKQTLFNDPRSLFGLAVVVIFMVVLKRA